MPLTLIVTAIISSFNRYLSIGEWVNCKYPDNRIFSTKRSCQATRRHGEILNAYLVSEKSQSEKAIYYMMPTIWHFGKYKTIERAKGQWLPGAWEEGGINRWRTGDF